MEMNNLLIEWGLSEFIQLFQEEGITTDILENLLDDDNLDKLIPKPLGKRLYLRKKILEYMNKNQDTINTLDNTLDSSLNITEDDNSEANQEIDKTVVSNAIRIFDVLPVASTHSESFASDFSQSHTKTDLTLSEYIQRFDLRQLLSTTAIGKALLSWYTLKGGFDSTRQGYLVEIIATHFLNRNYMHIANAQYAILAAKIIELFPCEISESYYLPPVRKRDSRDHKSGVAKGKLVDKFRNKLTFLREAGFLPSRETNQDNTQHNSTLEQDENVDPDINHSLIWLKHNNEPLSDVLHHWEVTFTFRRGQILNENNQLTLNDIYSKFSILSEPLAITLITKDFEKIFPNKSSLLYENWETVICKLIKLRKHYVASETDKLLLELLDSENIKTDYRHYLMITLLPSLLPCKARHLCKNKKQWKPKLVDSREGIILRAELPADVETLMKRKKEKLQSLGLPVQPYLIVEGSGNIIRKVYVIVNDKLYGVPTVLKGIDCCFHIYHVFNLKYQFESEHIWTFIQHSMYNLRTKWDSPIPNILDIVNKIKQT